MLPLIFYRRGSKKCKIWTQISTPVAFDVVWFENGATYQKSETCHSRIDDMPKYLVRNFAHPPLIFTGGSKLAKFGL